MATDTYQAVTDKIIAAIESAESVGRWIMPWHRSAGQGLPTNASSGKAYRGVNIPTLWACGATFESNIWATYKQWSGLGAQVVKGSAGAPVVFWKILEKTDTATGKPKKIFFARHSTVFNVAQVSGYSPPDVDQPEIAGAEHVATVENFVRNTGANVRTGGDRAFYAPGPDYVQMPAKDRFTGTATSDATESYYSTLLHELSHWTGHSSRLDRIKHDDNKRGYAFEELVAELSAAMLCAQLGVSSEPRRDHAQYLASWLKALKSDTKYIFAASRLAQAAADHLTELQSELQSEQSLAA